MINKYIGFGKLSLYYLYILYCFISNSLGNIILSFDDYYDKAEFGLFFFAPELNKHKIIKNLYKNLGYIIFGVIFYFIFLIKQKKNTLSNEEKNYNNNTNKTLIYNKNPYNPKNIAIHLLLTCFILAFHSELNTILGSFGFSGFDLWILNIIFTLVFMNYYFKIKLFKHQIYSLAFNFYTNLILLIICTFVANDYSNIENILGYKVIFIPIILVYALNSLIISFSRVKAKILMELNYIAPYKIIILTGCFGLLFCIITLIFSSIFQCNDNLMKKCKVKDEVDEKILYFDSIPIYFIKLINQDLYKILLEILVINPLYLLAKFMKFYFEILMVYYLNPIFILVSDSAFYGISYLFKAILNKNENNDNNDNNSDNIKFILSFLADIFSILSYLIYLEIIELRFCGLNTNTRKAIDERGRLDSCLIECGDINESNESIDE